MHTELDLPAQDKPTRKGFPATPAAIRKWLDELSHVDVREATRRFTEGVHTLNRLQIGPGNRLEIMELLRPTGREILDHLGGRIQAQTLPLPERTRKVFQLNIDLLREIALAYEIVLVALAGARRPGTGSRIALATERALAARGEVMLRSAQVYSPLPEGFWRRTHTVYARAEMARAATKAVREAELKASRRSQQRPVAMYKRLLMFAVAQTDGLRKAETERVYRALESWAHEAELRTPDPQTEGSPGSADADCRFAVDLATSCPPLAWRLHVGGEVETLRVLDLRRVIKHVEHQYEQTLAAERDEQGIDPDRIGSMALRRLLDNWQQRAVRRSERALHGEGVEVEVTLPRIHERIEEENKPKPAAAEPQARFTDTAALSLQTIERDDTPDDRGYISHPGHAQDDPADSVWDEVGRGRTRTKGFVQAQAEQQPKANDGPDEVHWILEDSSRTGFRLHWVGEGSSRATVGELIAVHVAGPEGGVPRWRVGVVRWIQFVGEANFLAGCAALSMHMSPASVRRDRARRKPRNQREPKQEPASALLLPGHRAKGQPPGLLLPAHMFHEGETVKMAVRDRTMQVRLAQIREHSGSFTQFDIAPARRAQGTGQSAQKSKPSVWDSL